MTSLVLRMTSLVLRMTSLVLEMTSLVLGMTSLVLRMTSLVLGMTSLVLRMTSLVLRMTSLVLGMTSLVLGMTGLVLRMTGLVANFRDRTLERSLCDLVIDPEPMRAWTPARPQHAPRGPASTIGKRAEGKPSRAARFREGVKGRGRGAASGTDRSCENQYKNCFADEYCAL
jgi:hypothetical protein